MTRKQMTYAKAIRTPGTNLHKMAEQQRKEHAARMKLTPEQREAYWREVCKPTA